MNAMRQSDKLMRARCRLLARSPFYGHSAMSMVWIPHEMPWKPEEERTMGVRIMSNGEIQCLYYPPFVDSLTLEELYGVIQHEIEHIVRCHCLRVGSRHPVLWNIAADFTVNGTQANPRIGYVDSNKTILPLDGKICWIPPDWPGDETAEYYYSRLVDEAEMVCENCAKGGAPIEGDSEGGKCSKCGGPCVPKSAADGEMIDDHSIWNQSEVSDDEARQIVKDMVQQVSAKCPGSVPGHLAEVIKALSKPVVRWRELLRHYFGRHVGNRRYTYSRRSRRHDSFGVKGVSHHAAATVNVIIDTSGSISSKDLAQFFAEIDMISSRATVNILQWDTKFQGYSKYRRGAWRNFSVHGRGGTCMTSAVHYLRDNGLVADVQVMLTDGYTSWADDVNFPFITVLTTQDSNPPPYGHVVRMNLN